MSNGFPIESLNPYIQHKFDQDLGGWEIGSRYAWHDSEYYHSGVLAQVTTHELFFKDIKIYQVETVSINSIIISRNKDFVYTRIKE